MGGRGGAPPLFVLELAGFRTLFPLLLFFIQFMMLNIHFPLLGSPLFSFLCWLVDLLHAWETSRCSPLKRVKLTLNFGWIGERSVLILSNGCRSFKFTALSVENFLCLSVKDFINELNVSQNNLYYIILVFYFSVLGPMIDNTRMRLASFCFCCEFVY